jgi:uroporphyrinogen-III decarboxylase
MGQFRDEAQDWITNLSEDDARKARRKAVNNICNDVSRISRDLLGHTIRCTSRKGGYIYTATQYEPVVSTTVEPSIAVSAVRALTTEVDKLKHELAGQKGLVGAYRALMEAPAALASRMIEDHGREAAGQAMVAALKESSAKEAAEIPF